ncbi:reverse transcriptase domain-containing protein [Tanacetum coccineum]
MPFGLRNVGATYQRLVDKKFHGQIGRNLKVYVDDLVIKSHTEDEIVRDIEETFKTLRKINMKLNPKKCTFEVEEGMFLGYQVNTKGIKICPDKVDAVLRLQSLKCQKDMQKLNGKLASLNRFLAKSAEKSLPFFKTLKKCTKKSDFLWTEEAKAVFRQMKKHIAKLPMLTAPEEQEELIVYLAASKEAVSVVLMTEREARQIPIYFVIRALRGPEVNYTSMEKLVLALVHASKRLRRYFQAHLIIVVMDQSIKNILSNPGGQVLADFIVERPEEEALRFQFEATNNEAEYEALIAGLRIAEKIGVQSLQVNVDSKLVANQVNGTYIAKETDMIKYLEKVKTLASTFRAFSIKQVPRSKNKKADALSKIASTSFAHLSKQVLVEELKEKSVNESEVLAVVEEEGDSWMTQIHEYLTDETLPAERKKARAIKRKSQRFAIINGILYKKSFLGPWLRCVGPSQANYVLREIHEGSCSMHAGTRSVVAKALRIGYYWPTMHKDARALIKACQECQVHKPVPRNPQEKLNPITSPWPFYKWGIDIAGPFPEGPGKVKFLIVAMDYFTKWIEAKPVATITGNQVKKFVWENIVCRFGLPGEIISDNGKQFRDNPFKDWCEKLRIQQHFASVKHPQTNGLVERANRSLGEGIKARLGKDNKNWMEEISHVLWAHRTMVKSSNGDTPFSLTYGTEAVIPAEIGMPTFRTAEVDMAKNDEALKINLELLEEKREQAAITEAKSKRQMEKYYNARVRNTSFKPRDLVYRNPRGIDDVSEDMEKKYLNGPASDATLREYCNKYYNQLLAILAKKMHQEKVQQEKLKEVKARLNFEEVSQHSKSGTPIKRRDLRKRLESRRIRSVSRTTTITKILKVVTKVPAQKEQNLLLRNTITKEHPHAGRKYYQKVKVAQEDTESHGKKSRDQALRVTIYPNHGYEENDPFTLRIRYFDLPKRTHMPSHIKTYEGSEDPEVHLKIFRVWFDDLPLESVDIYGNLKEAFLANFRQQKKCIKDHVEIHHIKQREGEFTEDFMRRFKVESKDVKGAPEIMRISGFMHGITNPELIKRLHDKIPKSVDEMMRITTSFLRGEVAAGNQKRKKSLSPWKQQEAGHKQNFKK